MDDQEAKEFLEEAINHGVIDYDMDGIITLYYKYNEIWGSIDPHNPFIYIGGEKGLNTIESKTLKNKLKLMFDAWEAI